MPSGKHSPHQAMLKFEHYVRKPNADAYIAAKLALENALEEHPNSAQAQAAPGALYVDEFVYFKGSEASLEKALGLVESAYRLDLEDYRVQLQRAYCYFYTRAPDDFIRASESAVQTNPNISTSGELALWYAFIGELDRAMTLFEQARHLNPHIPRYYYFTPFMAHAYQGKYEEMLSDALQIRMPEFHVDAIARAAALGYLGRQAETKTVVAELLQLVPDFPESGGELYGAFSATSSL